MQELELKISKKDWLIIFFIGIGFSMLITSLQYFLLRLRLFDGAVFGALLGGCIVLLSMLFISYLNTRVLPKLSYRYWVILAAFFSFLSGFFGTLCSYFLSKILQLELISKFEENIPVFAVVLGLLTYAIGSLLYQFVKMSNQKEFHQRQLYIARLKSLETQLNPHFLFNALNSLAELIHTDKDKAELAVMELSQFLRVGMKESALFTIQKELDNVKRYIHLENIRFNDKIQLNIDSDVKLQAQLLPKFSIQLLVENALKHSFSNEYHEFVIDIKIQKKDSTYITVQNNGKAVTQTKFAIGLSNLDERLRLLCGGRVELLDTNSCKYQITLGECDENIISR